MKKIIIVILSVVFLSSLIYIYTQHNRQEFSEESVILNQNDEFFIRLFKLVNKRSRGHLSTKQFFQIFKSIVEYSDFYNLDKYEVAKLIAIESDFIPTARNKGSGASGLGQILPSTGRYLNKRYFQQRYYHLFEIDFNIKLICRYLRLLYNTKKTRKEVFKEYGGCSTNKYLKKIDKLEF